jgi:hypothetical protein
MSYTGFPMKRFVGCIAMVIVSTAVAALAAESQYQEATILKLEQKTSTRVLYYVVNTPITQDDPYYELSVQLKGAVYTARYIPRHEDDELPDEWKPGSTVRGRVQGHHLFLKSASTTEVQLIITKTKALPPARAN